MDSWEQLWGRLASLPLKPACHLAWGDTHSMGCSSIGSNPRFYTDFWLGGASLDPGPPQGGRYQPTCQCVALALPLGGGPATSFSLLRLSIRNQYGIAATHT